MCTKYKCESCKFFKKHTMFAEKGAELIGGTCIIEDKYTDCVVANKVITFDLQRQCPLKKVKNHDKLETQWNKLRGFVINLAKESKNLRSDALKLLRDVMVKIKELEEKGE